MKHSNLFLGLVFGGVIAATGVTAHAQEQTTTPSESMTTTTNGAPPPPMAMQDMPAPQPGYETFGYPMNDRARRRGYNDGYDKGISDHDTGHSFRYKDDNAYRHPEGYMNGPMPKDVYEREYREAFVNGYEKGYRRSADSPRAR